MKSGGRLPLLKVLHPFQKKSQEINPSTPGLSLDFTRNGELAEPKAGVCSGLILSGALNPDLKIGVGAVERINS